MKPSVAAALGLLLCGAASCVHSVNAAKPDAGILAAGERAYQKCYSCHSLERPDANTQGPSLRQILGRPVASESGFDYSPAMRAYARRQSGWTSRALNDFIADPEGLVPGTAMGFFGIADASERHALIVYLSTK